MQTVRAYYNKWILFFFCLGAAVESFAQITFDTLSWKSIRAKAAAENKPIFVDAYTSWCGPCKYMEKHIFTQKAVGDFFNGRFINAKFDMEEGEGPFLGKLYDVGCYPSYLFIDTAGQIIHRTTGVKTVEEFLAVAEVVFTPGLCFSASQKKYDEGFRNPEFVGAYFQLRTFNCMHTGALASAYLDSLSENDLFIRENWEIFKQYVLDLKTPVFKRFLKNRPLFVSRFGETVVNQKIFDIYLSLAQDLIYRREEPDDSGVANLRREVAQLDFPRKEELKLLIDNSYAEAKRDWDAYFHTCKKLAETYRWKDSDFLNTVSTAIYMHSNNRQHLLEAENWAKRSVELDEGIANLCTYASLQNRNGKRSQAAATQQKAISKAKERGDDVSELEKTLRSYQAKKG